MKMSKIDKEYQNRVSLASFLGCAVETKKKFLSKHVSNEEKRGVMAGVADFNKQQESKAKGSKWTLDCPSDECDYSFDKMRLGADFADGKRKYACPICTTKLKVIKNR